MPPTPPAAGPSTPGQALHADDLRQVLDLLACPACHGPLRVTPATLACEECGRLYPVLDGIPILLIDRATRPTQP
jgi:uncharacterized protein YbaR (Trm112 family)